MHNLEFFIKLKEFYNKIILIQTIIIINIFKSTRITSRFALSKYEYQSIF